MAASRDEYTRTIWVNKTTPLSAQNLNNMEEGIALNNALAKECANFIDEIKSAIVDQLTFEIDPTEKTITLKFGTPAPQQGEEEQEGVYYTPNFCIEKIISLSAFYKTSDATAALAGKLDKSNTSNTLYGKDAQGNEANIYYSSDFNNKSLQGVIRDANSDVLVPTTPSTNNAAASKAYADGKVSKSGDTMTGALNLNDLIYSNYGEFRFNAHLYFTDNTDQHNTIIQIHKDYVNFWRQATFLGIVKIAAQNDANPPIFRTSFEDGGKAIFERPADFNSIIWTGGKEIRFPEYLEFKDNTNNHNVILKIDPNQITANKDLKITSMGSDNTSATTKQYVDTGLAGKADLINGVIPAAQLPSFVDDVIEFAKQVSGDSWLNRALETEAGTRVWNNTTASNLSGGTSSPYYKKFLINTNGTEAGLIIEEPEAGKIYVGKTDTNTYRWSGSNLVEISKSVGLGETSTTAYAGNKGKANAQAIEALQTGKADKSEVAAVQAKTRTITITQADWVNSSYSISLGTVVVGANDALFISPTDSCAQDYYNAGIVRSISNDGNTLTLTAATTPTNSITIQLVYLKGEAF